MQVHALLIPCPAQGHITPLLKLAKLLHLRGFYITFVNTEFNHRRLIRSRGPDAVKGVDGFQFRTIPDGLPPSDKDATQDISELCDSIRKNGLPPFVDLIRKLNDSEDCPDVSCIVSDGHMSFTLDAADHFQLPEVYFFTTSACGFWAYCHVSQLITRGICPLKDESQLTDGYLETKLEWVPGMKNMRLRDFPSFVRTTDPDDIMIHYNMLQTNNATRATTIILNTCEELEQQVMDALRHEFKQVLAIGPLHLLERHMENPMAKSITSSLWVEEDETCLPWLDQKPPGSVLYVNFGSITVLTPQQMLEFALGLANNNRYFLWVIRPDLVRGDSAVLPDTYCQEIKGRGMMVGWCSQERVLAHPAVGGFLTHCGWNSMIACLAEGVPMICWPFFAEQQTNCRYACVNWKVGVEMEGEVRREKVAEVVEVLMEGKEMRDKAGEWKHKVQAAAKPGGSSYRNLEFLVNQILLNN